MLRIFFALLLSILSTAVHAQDTRANTVLVMDGSGSMWGQIDGQNKIVIARDVIGNLLDRFPANQNLGLTVYGHRERGNCADIETVVPPGPQTIEQIRSAVNAINPRGKTPMTEAIIAAATALRYTEERATVILVSDGIETCHPDPCAAARALEEAGIDFTAHVIGFDVSDPKALAQMKCLANETGGQFETASNANELAKALNTVVQEPIYLPQTVDIKAVLKPGGAEIAETVDWVLTQVGENSVTAQGRGPGFSVALSAGQYELKGRRSSDGAEASIEVQVQSLEADQGAAVEVVFPELEPTPVTFRAVIATKVGALIDTPVFWQITAEGKGAVIDDAQANPLTVPLQIGSHQVTAYWAEQEIGSVARQFMVGSDPREILVVFDPPAVTASIGAPAQAVAGSTIEVSWSGPAGDLDFIGIGKAKARGSSRWVNSADISEGPVVQLLVPPQPGPYVIGYYNRKTGEALGAAQIEVTPAQISLQAPKEVGVNETFDVLWSGPDYPGDFIGVGKIGETGSGQWRNNTPTAQGSPLQLRAPAKPGDYLIKYFFDQRNWPAVEVPITVTKPEMRLTAPREADVSAMIEVAWTGPDTPGDFIGIGKAGETGSGQWKNYTRTSEGNPLQLRTPAEAGDYVIKYFVEQGNTPLIEVPITLREAKVSLQAPASAVAASTVEVLWTGPDTPGDFIGIGKVGETGSGQWKSYVLTETRSPAKLQVPALPGKYLIKYFLDQNNTPIASVPFTVEPVEASLQVPAVLAGGSEAMIDWTGPNNSGDFIGIGFAGQTGSGQWRQYVLTENGTPAKLRVPTSGGDYVIKYFLDLNNTPVFEVPVVVKTPPATLMAPSSAVAGSTIEVAWTGPNYAGDYIGLGLAGQTGSGQWKSYARTADGPVVKVTVPEEPGEYVLQYFVDHDRTSIASQKLTVK